MPRKHLNNLESTFTSASTGATSVTVTPAPADLAAGEYFWATIVDDVDATTQRETVKVTAAVSGALTFEPALANEYPSGGVVMASNPAVLFDEADGIKLIRYREPVYTATSGSFLRSNSGVQSYTMTADEPFTFPDLLSGESVLLVLTPSGFTGSWPSGSLHRNAVTVDTSTASGTLLIEILKVESTLFIADAGDYSAP